MNYPSVLGFPLSEARRILADSGCRVVEVCQTFPPAAGEGVGEPRVLRQRGYPGGVELVVAYPEFRPRGKREGQSTR